MELAHDYFEENLALLKKYHSQAWQAVMDYAGDPFGEFCLAADGNPNLLVRKDSGEEIFFHYTSNTDVELADYYALVPEDATGVAVFIGMGLGYTPPAMLQSRGHLRHLAVFEPETGIFIRALHAINLAPFLPDRRVSLAIGPNINVAAVLAPTSRVLQLESLHILRHNPCFQLFPETYQNIYDQVFKHGNAYNLRGTTTTVFGGKFIENRLRQISAIHHQHLLEHIKDIFTGVPAIIVAAGPSLDKNVHLLHQAKGRAVIFAVDAALPALVAYGVTPDFTTCIDMEDFNLEKTINVAASASETSLICSSWVTSLVPKTFPARQVYWTFTAQNMERWLNGLLGGTAFTTGASTVAHLNFISAIMLGCSPIVFVGQDLSFSEQASHAQHTSLSTSKDYQKKILENQEMLWVVGYGGGKVPTHRTFLGFKHHFEECMAACKGRKFVNATEGGVHLEGAEELSLQEVLDRYCCTQVDVAATIRDAEDHVQMPNRQRMINEFVRMLKNIDGIEKEMTSLERLAVKLSKEIADLREQTVVCRKFDMLPLAMQRQFRELDALNNSLDKAKVWALLDEATMEGLRLSDRLNHEIQQLADQPEKYLDWLSKSINRFTLINQFRRQVLGPFTQQLKRMLSHLQRVHFLLRKFVKQKGNVRETVLELLRLYFESGDHMLMEKTIEANCPEPAQSAELSFYLGVIAAHRCQFDEMERYFARSVALDPSWSGRIDECREFLADNYLGFARLYHSGIDQRVTLRMLFKAARYTTDHQALRQSLADEADLAVRKVEAEVSAGRDIPDDLAQAIVTWCRELMVNSNLAAVLAPESMAMLHRYHGYILLGKEEFAAAAQAFSAAIVLTPQTPQLHHLLADAAFAANDYPLGVASLDKAVALDSDYAKYWEVIGDHLVGVEQPESAIAAYEKCFTALPEDVGLLKKIGDCYLAIGQLEAAREAYRICQEKLIEQNG